MPNGASMWRLAYGSPRVTPRLTIATRIPCLTARNTNRRPDITVRDDPRTSSVRQFSTSAKLRATRYGGTVSPK